MLSSIFIKIFNKKNSFVTIRYNLSLQKKIPEGIGKNIGKKNIKIVFDIFDFKIMQMF